MIAVPCILPTQACNGLYQTKDETSRLSVPMVKGKKFREIFYKCTTDRFARVLKSLTMFVRADCSSHNALHQRSWNLSHFAGRCFILLVAEWLPDLSLPIHELSHREVSALKPQTAKLFPGDSRSCLIPSWLQLQTDQCTSSCLEIQKLFSF